MMYSALWSYVNPQCRLRFYSTFLCTLCREYERTFEQNDDLGLNDMNTENYDTEQKTEPSNSSTETETANNGTPSPPESVEKDAAVDGVASDLNGVSLADKKEDS